MKKEIKKKEIYKRKKKFILFLLTIFFNSNLLNKKRDNNFKPKISIFLPIYNKAKFLKRSIRSIQMQTLSDLEIIPVNDYSEDNSLEILKKMAKSDSRIKIINNDRNRGLLYSRAMGILNSRGEYIMNLDPDDEFEGPDNLKYLYNIINKFKVDIISFGIIKKVLGSFDSKLYFCSNYKNIQFQPEILDSNTDFLIWNKLVKNKIFKKAYRIFKEKINGEKWNYAEDEVWSALINKIARTKICVRKIIYIYHINNFSLVQNRNNWIEMFKKNFYYQNEKTYISRFDTFLITIERNKYILSNIIKNKEIYNKYLNIFRNITFHFNINNSTLKDIIDSLKK